MTQTPTSAAAIVSGLACSDPRCTCARAAKRGSGVVHCPAHDDGSPSLNVQESQGQPLFFCHANCSQEAVIEALRKRGLWAEPAVSTNGHAKTVTLRYAYLTPAQERVFHMRVERPGQKKLMWWEDEAGVHHLPEGVKTEHLPLYRADDLAARPDDLVLILEGEKKTDAAREHGFLAVSVPGGASQPRFGSSLDVLRGRDVVLLPDNDEPGRKLMRVLALLLRTVARSVVTVELPGLGPAGDVADFFAAGGTAAQLNQCIQAAQPTAAETAAQPQGPRKPSPRKARDLQVAGLPEIGFAVGGILPEGVTLCAGRPKQGKSFLALNLAIAVAAGGKALGDLAVSQGDVLYLTLEGGEHGFLPRLNTMLAGALAPDALEYETEWPRLEDGGAAMIGDWLAEHPMAKLVVIDTLAKVRPPTNNKSGIYEQDYAAVQSLVQLALSHHVAILVIHHTRKAVADDPLDTVSGSTGLTGAVDAVWILQRVRGQKSATLTVSGRSFPDDDLGLEWDERLCCWNHAGAAEDVKRSQERREILGVYRTEGASVLTARQVSDLLDMDHEAVRKTMYRMSRSGELAAAGRDGYRLVPTSNEVSHMSPQSPVSQVSHMSHIEETDGTSGTYGTGDSRARPRDQAPARVYETSPDEPPEDGTGPPCPRGCGVELRDGWCAICKYQEG